MFNKSPEELRKVRMEHVRKAAEDRRRRFEDKIVRLQKEEQKERARWDATARFKPTTIKPPAGNKNADSMIKFTVWCSAGFDNDGWHSWGGEPDKLFDSSWKTKKEANDRAEYLFFWKNVWNVSPQEVSDDNGEPKPSEQDGMKKWTVAPSDSKRWTVGVVPASAFQHLEKACLRRHIYDDERLPQGY